jgi:hypothetical protein
MVTLVVAVLVAMVAMAEIIMLVGVHGEEMVVHNNLVGVELVEVEALGVELLAQEVLAKMVLMVLEEVVLLLDKLEIPVILEPLEHRALMEQMV